MPRRVYADPGTEAAVIAEAIIRLKMRPIVPIAQVQDYVPHTPHPRQHEFLSLTCREAFYGGAAGGGKSDALLMAALQYVHVPGYAALLLRRSYADLAMPGALMDLARDWLGPTDAKWNDREHTWEFPSGATVTFGYMQVDRDKFRYKGPSFQFIGWDELTQFFESQYRFMFSRLRRLAGSNVPIRMRSASNPGDVGHDWVKRRFIEEGPERGRVFVPARLEDNPSLDYDEYVESLAELDPVTRAQMLMGDWTARTGGSKFKREWFEIVGEAPVEGIEWCRYWDLAATEPKPERRDDPDWTAGVKLGRTREGIWYVGDVRRIRARPLGVQELIAHTAAIDGKGVRVRMEQEPGSSGVNTIDHYRRQVLSAYDFKGIRSTGTKEVRANPVSSQAEARNMRLVRGAWNTDYLDELEGFPTVSHDDQVDATSGAYAELAPARSWKAH